MTARFVCLRVNLVSPPGGEGSWEERRAAALEGYVKGAPSQVACLPVCLHTLDRGAGLAHGETEREKNCSTSTHTHHHHHHQKRAAGRRARRIAKAEPVAQVSQPSRSRPSFCRH